MVLSPGRRIAVTEEDKEAQRQKIIKAAIKIFGQHGYYKSTISQIAKEADMGRGTLYWYFKSKEDLFRVLIKQAVAGIMDQLMAQISQAGSLEQKVKIFVRSWLDYAVQESDLLHIFYSVFAQSEGEFVQEMIGLVRGMYIDMIEILKNMLDQEIVSGHMRTADTRRLSRLLIGLLDGIALQHMFVEKIDSQAMTEVVSRLVLQGLQPENIGRNTM